MVTHPIRPRDLTFMMTDQINLILCQYRYILLYQACQIVFIMFWAMPKHVEYATILPTFFLSNLNFIVLLFIQSTSNLGTMMY